MAPPINVDCSSSSLQFTLIVDFTSSSLQVHFQFTLNSLRFRSVSLQFHLGLNYMSLWFNFDLTSSSLRTHIDVISDSLRCHFELRFLCVSLLFHFGRSFIVRWIHFDLTSTKTITTLCGKEQEHTLLDKKLEKHGKGVFCCCAASSTLQPDTAHARTNERTKRNDFPVGLTQPT